jgi:phosphomannomutase/phosphoglucomutase
MSLETRRLFGTNGVRGVANVEITPQFAIDLGASIGTFFDGGKLLVARDGRTSSVMLLEATVSGLMQTGCNVFDIGMAPTPALQYITQSSNVDGAVMITASHNPPEYNGIKVIDKDGIELERQKEVEIERIYAAKGWKPKDWKSLGTRASRSGALDEYKEAIKRHVSEERIRSASLKVVVDPGNGVGALVTPYLLRELGCRVYTINANVDGEFPGRLPEPAIGNLTTLCAAVKAFGADLGVAHDGDADRAIFVDETGTAHWGDRSVALTEKYFLLENKGETIVTPVSSSMAIEEIAEAYGGKVVRTPVGSINVSRTMQRIGAKFGGEENGGIFYGPHIAVRDGAMAASLIVDIMSKTGKPLSTLLSELPRHYSSKSKVACPNAAKDKVLEKLRQETEKLKVETLDGVKIRFEDGSWILIRPSGTEPIFRLFAEAKTNERASALVEEYSQIVGRIVKNN